jgi:phage terminase small subunit
MTDIKKTELTPKQENFCLAYIETGNASEAYRKTYNAEKMKETTINRKAKELLDNGKITARLNELRQPIIERHKITVDDLIAELDENRKAALGAETVQSAAATAATMAKAKLLGYDKQIVELTGQGGPIQSVTAFSNDPIEAAKAYMKLMRGGKS